MFQKLRRMLTPAKSMDTETARQYIADHPEGSYTLLDVRQPSEYEQGHIPGAKLIPLPQLSDSMDQIAEDKPILVYCAVGGRSRVAAQMLAGESFTDVYNISGGFKAWNGFVAEGPYGLNTDLLSGAESPEEILRFAYGMENNLGEFYRTMAHRNEGQPVADLLTKLASIEDKHKTYLVELYRTAVASDGTEDKLESEATSDIMEGGYTISEFIEQNEQYLEDVPGVLDIAMMLESQALDLYLKLGRQAEQKESQDILMKISEEERGHLHSLAELREKNP